MQVLIDGTFAEIEFLSYGRNRGGILQILLSNEDDLALHKELNSELRRVIPPHGGIMDRLDCGNGFSGIRLLHWTAAKTIECLEMLGMTISIVPET